MKLLFFDTETTGTSPQQNCIHQLAGMVVIEGAIREKFSFNICPDDVCVVEDEALSVSGKTRVQIASYAPGATVLADLLAILNKYVDRFNKADKFYLVGYNSRSFDEPFLRSFFERHGNKFYGAYFHPVGFDLIILAAERLKHCLPDMPNFRLATVAGELGITVDGSRLHDAMYDVELTYSIYEALQTRIDAAQLARKVLATLDAQKEYSRHATAGSALAVYAKEQKTKLEADLRKACEEFIKPSPQPMLF